MIHFCTGVHQVTVYWWHPVGLPVWLRVALIPTIITIESYALPFLCLAVVRLILGVSTARLQIIII